MPLPHIPRDTYTYTNAPEQHPNFILGSLQILFWLFFRPTALRNDLKQIFETLEIQTNTTSRLLLRLRIQVYLVLPFLVNLILGLTLWRLEQSVENILLWVAWGVAWSVWLHMGLILMALRMTLLQLEWFVASVLVVGITLSVMFEVSWGFIWSVLVVVLPLGALAFFGKFPWSWFFSVVTILVLSIVLRFVFSVPVLIVPSTFTLLRMGLTLIMFLIVLLLGLGALMGKVSWGMFLIGMFLIVAFSLVLASPPLVLGLGLPMWGIGATINLWRPAIFTLL
ncbi:hypothetical protein [Nostoc sp. 'Peltigera malacea cyanobiont' DB3992]|uniref:hypothetical protein n=1 Tax=Nostoc sp. 'Peltigera malacea cyanobiont' DB3992 TaxID=1206980 RepID=UPI0015D4C934|nr:hypothetical protein [Nostoc sp. 'Peltigera malacea cyanobiont' DB3992]